jgi:GT2 family glycosyltransferase
MDIPSSPSIDTQGHEISRALFTNSPGWLSILLVNYNGKKFLEPCIESIERFAPAGAQVVLEDNASTDGSVELVEERFPWVMIIRSNLNLGFARGNNIAAKNANSKYLLLLNTDTVLLDPIESVLNWLDCHPSYGAVTIRMLDGDRVAQACTGRFPTPLRLMLLRSMLVHPKMYGSDQSYDVDWVQGSFLLIRTDLWRRLNGLDETFFMYAEDVDLCKRIQLSGLRCALLPGHRYLHWGGFNPKRFPDQISGLARYVDHHFPGRWRWLSRAILLCGCLLRAAAFGLTALIEEGDLARSKSRASLEAFRRLIALGSKGAA